MMDFVPQVQKILIKILNSERMIQSVVLTDRTGLTLTSVSKDEHLISHASSVGALASNLYTGSAAHGKDLLGNLELMLSEFKDGNIFLKGAGPTIIAVVTKNRASINKIRRALKRYAKKVTNIVKDMSIANFTITNEDKQSFSKALEELSEL